MFKLFSLNVFCLKWCVISVILISFMISRDRRWVRILTHTALLPEAVIFFSSIVGLGLLFVFEKIDNRSKNLETLVLFNCVLMYIVAEIFPKDRSLTSRRNIIFSCTTAAMCARGTSVLQRRQSAGTCSLIYHSWG